MPSIITQETETQERFDGNGYSIGLFEATAGYPRSHGPPWECIPILFQQPCLFFQGRQWTPGKDTLTPPNRRVVRRHSHTERGNDDL